MSNKQYIGARYVPLFMGVHDPSIGYEALSIVTDAGQATSYTSKKNVPVGIDLTNTEYWAITGTLSGSILQLQQRMSNVEFLSTNLENKIDNNIEPLVDPLNNKIIVFGDSWSAPDGTHDWTAFLKNTANLDLISYAKGGRTYTSTSNPTIGDEVTTFLNDTIDFENVGTVIFLGGINDLYSGSVNTAQGVVIQAIEEAKRVKSKCPNARIIFILNVGFPYYRRGTVINNSMWEYSTNFINIMSAYYPCYSTIPWFKNNDYEADHNHVTANNRNLMRNILSLIKNYPINPSNSFRINKPYDTYGSIAIGNYYTETSCITDFLINLKNVPAGNHVITLDREILIKSGGAIIINGIAFTFTYNNDTVEMSFTLSNPTTIQGNATLIN